MEELYNALEFVKLCFDTEDIVDIQIINKPTKKVIISLVNINACGIDTSFTRLKYLLRDTEYRLMYGDGDTIAVFVE